MQIINKDAPPAPPAEKPTQGYATKLEAVKAKLAATMQPKPQPAAPQAQETPVSNPSKVTVEELSAITPPASIVVDKGQADTTETPVAAEATPAAPKAAEEPNSSAFAQLARREKAMRVEAQKLKAEREALQAEREALKPAPAAPIDRSRFIDPADLESDPLAALAKLGISYDSLTQRALNAPTPEQIEYSRTVTELRNEIKALREEQDGIKNSSKQQQEEGYKQAINQITSDVKSLVYSSETYELVKATNSTKDVVDLIEKTFKEGLDDDHPKGTLLGIEEAAKIVEDYLEGEALKLARLKKIQTKLKPAEVTQAAPKAGATTPNDTKQSQVKTLTNGLGTAKQYTTRERAMLAAQYGPDWRSKVS